MIKQQTQSTQTKTKRKRINGMLSAFIIAVCTDAWRFWIGSAGEIRKVSFKSSGRRYTRS